MDTFPTFMFFILVLLLTQKATTAKGRNNISAKDNVRGVIGAIIDTSSRLGKEQKVAMETAVNDVYEKTNQSYGLRIKVSEGEPYRAALAARNLIGKQEVQAIVLPQPWEEASVVAEIGNLAKIPVLSIADSTPLWATKRWPFLLQASPNKNEQMKAIAAIVQSWEWRRVTVICEDIDSFRSGVIPHLSDALREVGAEISNLVALSPFDSFSVSRELERLKSAQCRVFVVHLSFELALHFLTRAKEMNMMEKDFVWITTDPFTSLLHSLNASIISSMQGTIGVKSYYPQNDPHFQNFRTRFRKTFMLKYPEEDIQEPGTSALQAYDAVWTLCLAMKETRNGQQQILHKIMVSKFGNVQFTDRKVASAHRFRIINVVGPSHKDLGVWSRGFGFSETTDERTVYSNSMRRFGQVFWPGGPRNTPRGWALPTKSKPLRIGVPTKSSFKQYVRVQKDPSKNITSYEGFAIDLFHEIVETLPFSLPYDFTPFNGTYDELVEQVYLENFDAVVGDVSIVAKRYQHAEFTHPYTESGLVMIAPIRSRNSNRAWLFMKPFTKAMWALVGGITVYNGFVVWLIERKHRPELKGCASKQVAALLCLAFMTLFSLHGQKLRSNLSRMATVVWVFVALVITQTYVANLASILTVQQLEPTVADVDSLRNSNAAIGYCNGSFVASYLVEVLNFPKNNIKGYNTPEEYAQALRNQEIAAAFLQSPFAKLFLAKYCKEFIVVGPTYEVGGFGFVFPRGSPLLPNVTKALLNVSENGRLRDLEKSMLASEECVDVESVDELSSISPSSIWVLFVFTGGTSTIALMFYVVRNKRFGHAAVWRLAFAVMKHWWRQKTFSRRVSDVQKSKKISNTSYSRTQV